MVEIGSLDDTPVGPIWVAGSERGVLAVSLWDEGDQFAAETARLGGEVGPVTPGSITARALAQLAAYLRGELREFDLPLDLSPVTPFRREVLQHVCAVPYGRTTSYRAIAEQIGRPGAVRAVGQANATNPIPIIIPCHRILGSDGKLHGYGARGGVETKAWLLRLEGNWLL